MHRRRATAVSAVRIQRGGRFENRALCRMLPGSQRHGSQSRGTRQANHFFSSPPSWRLRFISSSRLVVDSEGGACAEDFDDVGDVGAFVRIPAA